MGSVRPGRAGIAGVVVGLAIVAGAMATAPGEPPPTPQRQSPSERFLSAWHHSRMSTWVVTSRFTRVTEAGGRLTFAIHHAQRPPDELRFGLGSVSARRGDIVLACGGGEQGPDSLRCRRAAAAKPWAVEVEAEIALLRSYLEGPQPLYRVTDLGGGCFGLTEDRRILSPPYGKKARFCFDPKTGAPVYTRIERIEGVDETEAEEVRATVTEADLAPREDRGGEG